LPLVWALVWAWPWAWPWPWAVGWATLASASARTSSGRCRSPPMKLPSEGGAEGWVTVNVSICVGAAEVNRLDDGRGRRCLRRMLGKREQDGVEERGKAKRRRARPALRRARREPADSGRRRRASHRQSDSPGSAPESHVPASPPVARTAPPFHRWGFGVSVVSDDTGRTTLASRTGRTCGEMPQTYAGSGGRRGWVEARVPIRSSPDRRPSTPTRAGQAQPHRRARFRPSPRASPTPTGAVAAITPQHRSGAWGRRSPWGFVLMMAGAILLVGESPLVDARRCLIPSSRGTVKNQATVSAP